VGKLGLLVFITAMLIGMATVPVSATDYSGLAAARIRQAQLAQVRAQLGASLAAGIAAQDQLTQSLHDNRVEEERLTAAQADADAKIAALDAEITALDAQMADTQTRIDRERRQVAILARAMYIEPESILVELGASSNLGDFVTRMGDLNAAGARARGIKASLQRDEDKLKADREKQAADRKTQADLRAKLLVQLAGLQAVAARQQAALESLWAQQAQTQAEMYSASRQSTATAQYIADMLQAQQNEVAAAASQAVWDQVQLLGGQVPAASGDLHFTNPLPGGVTTQGFGPSPYAFEPPYGGYAHFHTGLDLSTPAGVPVLAAGDGVVLLAGFNNGGYGNYVVIGHAAGIDTLYGHLMQILVKQGQHVAKGQPIGLEGSTGNSTGPHLHFEVRQGGRPVNPLPFLTG